MGRVTMTAEAGAEGRYAAVSSRDGRFDGRFFTAVLTTGIYCRPSCPARTPLRKNVRFYNEAAAAEVDGFRACKRCRPDRAPDAPEVDVRGDLVGRALRLIASGTVGEDGVAALATKLHVSERHLHRLFVEELGVGLQAVARSRRVKLARGLLENSQVPVADIAFASGFGSLRQFNDAVKIASGLTPTEIRRAVPAHREPGLAMRLSFREPYDAALALRWVAGHALPGVEEVVDGIWRRTVPGGTVELTPLPGHWLLQADLADARIIGQVVKRAKRVLDLDADPAAIHQTLNKTPALAELVSQKPGLRCLGAWDAFEGLIRIIVGQQVSVRGGATLAGRLARAAGTPLANPRGTLTHVFPSAEEVVATDLSTVGLTKARLATVQRLAQAVVDGDVPLDGTATAAEVLESLDHVKGIGPWTLSCAAMRVLRDPDAWPAGDLILRRACERHGIDPDGDNAEFQPWRAYAATHLWEDIWTAPR